MKIYSIILFSLLIVQITFAQVSEQWVKTYNGGGESWDIIHDMVVDSLGNIYITGESRDALNDTYISTVGYGPDGTLLWSRIYNESFPNDYHIPVGMVKDNQGNLYVAAMSQYFTGMAFVDRILLLKYNTSGGFSWERHFIGFNQDSLFHEPSALTIDKDNNIIITGRGDSASEGTSILTIKYNPSGEILWYKRFYGSSFNSFSDRGNSVLTDNTGNIYVTGQAKHLSNVDGMLTLKYNSSGVLQWQGWHIGTFTDPDRGLKISLSNDGNIIAAGESDSGIVTIKYNSLTGDSLWVRRYDGPGQRADKIKDLKVDNNGDIYIAGASTRETGTYTDFLVIKYSNSGVEQWKRRFNYGNSFNDIFNSIQLDGLGGIYVTGNGEGLSPLNGRRIVTVKYNSAGDSIWTMTYDGGNTDPDVANVVKVDNQGSVIVGGSTSFEVVQTLMGDFVTIKYSQLTNLNFSSSNIPDDFKLYNNYPNPFNPVTRIKFSVPSNSGKVNIKVYDIMGIEKAVLVNDNLNAGTYDVTFDGSSFPSGVYFYRLQTERIHLTQKMILIK